MYPAARRRGWKVFTTGPQEVRTRTYRGVQYQLRRAIGSSSRYLSQQPGNVYINGEENLKSGKESTRNWTGGPGAVIQTVEQNSSLRDAILTAVAGLCMGACAFFT